MPRIKTEEFTDRIAKGEYKTILLRGLQNGEFCMLLEAEDGIYIHENNDGSPKQYRKIENALDWLKRKTPLTKIEVDITLWKENSIRGNG